MVTQRISPARSRGTDSSGSRGGAGATNEGKQKAFVPPPAGRAGRVPREDFEGSSHSPPAGFASRGRVVSPRRGTRRPPLGASGALPPRFARLRGRGLPRFCRLHHVGPLRPGIGTSCTKHRILRFFTSAFPGLLARHKDSSASRFARVPRNHFPRCNPRVLLEIKDDRFPLHKLPVSTSPSPLTPAFPRPFPFREMSAVPRPDLPTQSGRADTHIPGEPRSPAPRALKQ